MVADGIPSVKGKISSIKVKAEKAKYAVDGIPVDVDLKHASPESDTEHAFLRATTATLDTASTRTLLSSSSS